jgi:hypothetical protein
MDLFFNELCRQSYLELEEDIRLGIIDDITVDMIIEQIENNIENNIEMILNKSEILRKYKIVRWT